MLKITTNRRADSITFVLEGRLCCPWTVEAEREWSNLLSNSADKDLVLDIAGVTFVDSDGEALLTTILERGPKVRARGVLMGYLIQQVRQRLLQKAAQLSRGTPEQSSGVP